MWYGLFNAKMSLSVLVEPKVYVSAGSSALIDGGNETTVATCIAERARPPADVSWETNLYGTSEAHMQDDANGTTTTQVHYTWQPSRHAQGHTLTCVVKHPALQSDFRIPYIINVQCEYLIDFCFIIVWQECVHDSVYAGSTLILFCSKLLAIT